MEDPDKKRRMTFTLLDCDDLAGESSTDRAPNKGGVGTALNSSIDTDDIESISDLKEAMKSASMDSLLSTPLPAPPSVGDLLETGSAELPPPPSTADLLGTRSSADLPIAEDDGLCYSAEADDLLSTSQDGTEEILDDGVLLNGHMISKQYSIGESSEGGNFDEEESTEVPRDSLLFDGLSNEFLSFLSLSSDASQKLQRASLHHVYSRRLSSDAGEGHLEEDEEGTEIDTPERFKHLSVLAEVSSTLVENQHEKGTLIEQLESYRQKLAKQGEMNFLMERDLRKLDQRIGLLVTHRITAQEEVQKSDKKKIVDEPEETKLSPKQKINYGSLLGMVKNRPKYTAMLARQLGLSEIDDLLHTVMFTIYGNNFVEREEHLLLMMFEHAMRMEFETANDLGSLMRSNTAMSRMMTAYTRRGLGQQYLKEILLPQLGVLMGSTDVALEIDPVKVYRDIHPDSEKVSVEIAAEDPQVQTTIVGRVKRLQELGDMFLKAIIESLELVPFGVRWLCKKIRDSTEQQFPDAPKEQILSLIGGFYLLRYVNPAIVTPEAFGIVKRRPAPAVRRNLTLIAKILQNMANQTSHSKDVVSRALKDYLAENTPRLHTFLGELCDVDEFYDDFKLENLSSLGKNERLEIRVNEVYNLHLLLLKYREKLDLQDGDPLIEMLDSLGPCPSKLKRKDDSKVALDLPHDFEREQFDKLNVLSRLSSCRLLDDPTQSEKAETRPEKKKKGVARTALQQAELELTRTKQAFEGMCESYQALQTKFDAYQAYLTNVRGQAVYGDSMNSEFKSFEVGTNDVKVSKAIDKQRKRQNHVTLYGDQDIARLKLTKLDKEGVVVRFDDTLLPAIGHADRKLIALYVAMPKVGQLKLTIKKKGADVPLFTSFYELENILEKAVEANPEIEVGRYMALDAKATLLLLDRQLFKSSH